MKYIERLKGSKLVLATAFGLGFLAASLVHHLLVEGGAQQHCKDSEWSLYECLPSPILLDNNMEQTGVINRDQKIRWIELD